MAFSLDYYGAVLLALPALILTTLLSVWRPPSRSVPGVVTALHLLVGALVLARPLVECWVPPQGWVARSWCGTLVGLAYLTAALLVMDRLLVAVPALAAAVARGKRRVKKLTGRFPQLSFLSSRR